ncbi:hypothetical protein FLAG1_07731 [Fusarium langsethiae]|uniref:Uncharacterized protein n=1 Tax=Fusarium langsethiae TaxID=179993 RepID=A0A0M9ET78_FUSLA|nr:hypothetical protein FLAG1_07731 [Fusarium langsethiae]GKU03910.1 unnamed protein product [Fusarium langsethiae]GKU18876.1 unnamed protein product [Fusarium langsethiae]
MPKSKGGRSASARKNPIEGRSSRRTKKSSTTATKKSNAKKPVKKERVQELESDNEETAGNVSANESVDGSADGESNTLEPAGEDMALTIPQRPAPPGWTWQLVPITYHGETAGEVAYRLYGENMKTDSALIKRLYDELALRPAIQRHRNVKLNMMRRSNVEAFLSHLTGVPVAQPCRSCARGYGPWTECIIYDGQMCGSCTNCWYNASGSRCTFHENNQTCIFVPAPFPLMQTGGMPLLPMRVSPMLTAPNTVPSQYYSAYTNGQPSAQQHNPLERLQSIGAISSGISGTALDRLIGRIESAAIELGNRIGEFQEFVQTPEGYLMMAQRTAQVATPSESTVEEIAEVEEVDSDQEN